MAIGFERSRNITSSRYDMTIANRKGFLDQEEVERLRRIKDAWNFYEGYHWELMPEADGPELTINYCRAFVDKFVAFELGKAFTVSALPKLDRTPVDEDGRTLEEFLQYVWEDNDQFIFCNEMGQMKSVTGDAWVQVRYFPIEELNDPFLEYPKGRIGIKLHSSHYIFPKYDPHVKGKLLMLTLMYEYKAYDTNILGNTKEYKYLFKQDWTPDTVVTDYGNGTPVETIPNELGFIPFVHIRNLVQAGREDGRGDLDDIIPLNIEYNTKSSNISEIIDYHSAPVTVVYGAKIGNLEKGANKVWGGLPKDSKIENLTMATDLSASKNYVEGLKLSMCEVAGIPETCLGGAQAVSNTSGVALQYINLPLIEKTRMKRMNTENGLETLCKYIAYIALEEGLIFIPEKTVPVSDEDESTTVLRKDFFWFEVDIPDTLPKDTLLEMQQIQQEMILGLESRYGAMSRLGKENIERQIEEIDTDMSKNPELYGKKPKEDMFNQINSGMTNGQTTLETVRKETTGQNGITRR